LAMSFNAELQDAVRKLNGDLVGAHVVYADTYNVLSAIITNPSDYGLCFILPSNPFRFIVGFIILLVYPQCPSHIRIKSTVSILPIACAFNFLDNQSLAN
jgi:hypothetical protein